MEEKLFTQSDITAIMAELNIQIKSLQDRNASLAVILNRTNQVLKESQSKVDESK